VMRMCSCVASLLAIIFTLYAIMHPTPQPPRLVDSLAGISMSVAVLFIILAPMRVVQCDRCRGKIIRTDDGAAGDR
jgi:hypothetical protein